MKTSVLSLQSSYNSPKVDNVIVCTPLDVLFNILDIFDMRHKDIIAFE